MPPTQRDGGAQRALGQEFRNGVGEKSVGRKCQSGVAVQAAGKERLRCTVGQEQQSVRWEKSKREEADIAARRLRPI